MRTPHLAILVSAGVTAAALGLAVTAAQAAPAGPPAPANGTGTWSVSPMNGFDLLGNVGPVVIRDPGTGGTIRCAFGGGAITDKGGMGLRGTLVKFNPDFSQCQLPDGTSVTLTTTLSTIWTLTGRQFDPSRNLGVTSGRMHGVSLPFSSSTCSGVFDGTAAGANDGGLAYQFYNNPHWLITRTFGSTLHVYNVSGCTGTFTNGDTVTLRETMPALALIITSP